MLCCQGDCSISCWPKSFMLVSSDQSISVFFGSQISIKHIKGCKAPWWNVKKVLLFVSLRSFNILYWTYIAWYIMTSIIQKLAWRSIKSSVQFRNPTMSVLISTPGYGFGSASIFFYQFWPASHYLSFAPSGPPDHLRRRFQDHFPSQRHRERGSNRPALHRQLRERRPENPPGSTGQDIQQWSQLIRKLEGKDILISLSQHTPPRFQ